MASDVDLYWTYVGGTRRCIGAILRCADLEAVSVELDQGLTVDSDVCNWLSTEEKSRGVYSRWTKQVGAQTTRYKPDGEHLDLPGVRCMIKKEEFTCHRV